MIMKKEIIRLLIKSALLALIVSGVGIIYNIAYSDGVEPFSTFRPPEEKLQEDSRTVVDITRIKEHWDSGNTIFVDTRAYSDYFEGHISGAFPLPYDNLDEYFPKIQEFVTPDYTIITYCDGAECLSSQHVADFLNQNGYPDVIIFFGGWEYWLAESFPVESGAAF